MIIKSIEFLLKSSKSILVQSLPFRDLFTESIINVNWITRSSRVMVECSVKFIHGIVFANRSISFIIFSSLIILAGCNKKQIKQHVTAVSAQQSQNFQEILALHSELPDTMIGFYVDSIQENSDNSSGISIVYKPKKNTVVNFSAIQKMYIADMETLGWKLIAELVGDVIHMIFQKPGNSLMCTIVVHTDFIVITVIPKKS